MINETIGKYKINRLIGEGGMASVYEAEHEMLGTKVAIKVLNPILSTNAQIKERFRNEAKLMASLDHPNITKVIDFDEKPNQLSIVMEYLNGGDLNQKIKRNGPLSEKEINDVFSQTLSAFQYAHEKGIVHRDIKPSNIFILPNGHVKILDFGIAKLFGQGNEMTQTGTQIGTPIYMSPEQVKADKSIDHRSDIYSLGVTLFFAINGKPAYNSETDSQFDIFNKIVYETLPEFSIQSKFKEIVLKACQKNREERFQQCNSWLSEMNNPLRGLSSAPITNDETVISNKVNDDATQFQQPFKKTTTTSTQGINENTRVYNTKQETEHKVNTSNSTSGNLPQEKKSKTGLIIGIVAGVVLLINIIVASSGPSEEEIEAEAIADSLSNIAYQDSLEVSLREQAAADNKAMAISQEETSPYEKMLLGTKIFGVQFIWDKYGTATISKINGIIEINGEQWSNDRTEYAIINGRITIKDDRTLIFNGNLKLFTKDCCGEINLNKSFTFKRFGDRQYYRLQERNSLCPANSCFYDMDIFL
jgi:serine/threonine protein kinase